MVNYVHDTMNIIKSRRELNFWLTPNFAPLQTECKHRGLKSFVFAWFCLYKVYREHGEKPWYNCIFFIPVDREYMHWVHLLRFNHGWDLWKLRSDKSEFDSNRDWPECQNKIQWKFITRVIEFIDMAAGAERAEKPENTAFVSLVKWI